MAKNYSEWRLRTSQYLGEISAVCFLHLPSHLSSLPFLLAVLLYNLEAGKLIESFQVFEGIRLHGITCNLNCEGSLSTTFTFEAALFGEKKVKLCYFKFELSPTSQNQPAICVNLSLVHSLPRLSDWVLDVCFLKACVGSDCLAIGCSDNSVRVWDISNSSFILEVHSPERCLLYSVKLWGESLEALRIASGTIYNEIIIWKVDCQYIAPLLTSPEENGAYGSSSVSKCAKLQHQQHKALNIFRLIGHEGSIFRIEWSSCGSKLVSVSDDRRKMLPKNLHMQFHGREMHTLCFVSENLLVGGNVKKCPLGKSSWIATGCEDGTVRLTRYSPGIENWSSSKFLGEHVGGSAVRSICFVSGINEISTVVDNVSVEINRQNGAAEDQKNPLLLISVGAKRVLTSWLLRNRRIDKTGEKPVEQKYDTCENGCKHSLGASSSLSFQWLSTDMPTKNSSTHEKTNDTKKMEGIARNITSMNIDTKTGSISPESWETEAKTLRGDKYEDDWRYLAVTAFLVKCPGSISTICFVVVACSDATLALRALILPHRLWFDVAMLVPLSSPVLALQHVIIPLHLLSKATDGSIAFWDLTEYVEEFVQQVLTLHIENVIDCQKRPRTRRGSQSGRWWRTLSHTMPKKKVGSNEDSVKDKEGLLNHDPCGMSAKSNDAENCTVKDVHIASSGPELNTVDLTSEICEIHPMHVLSNAHQSGVNCLHVSKIRNCRSTNYGFQFSVVSGGDDQAIHCLTVDLSLLARGLDSEIIVPDVIHTVTESENVKSSIYYGEKQNQNNRIRFFNHYRATSAHSSAIKGIWTDGAWVFSTCLDQRVRCWLLEEDSKLTERAHLIVSVPEPEALGVRACGRNHYQIAVAGRGIQIVEFYTSPGVDEGQ